MRNGGRQIGLHYIEFQGKRQTLTEWAKEVGIGMATLSSRICQLGWSVERALTTPKHTSSEAARIGYCARFGPPQDMGAGLASRMTPYAANNYIPVPEAGCWLWLGARTKAGYGRLGRHGRSVVTASRLFYAYHKGEIPDGLLVCHKCDTPLCVNPDHLFLGTHKDNARDMLAKGRGRAGGKPTPPTSEGEK